MALWAYLEKVSNKQKIENPGDFFKQGFFVLVCALVSVLIDQFALESIVETILGDTQSLALWQVLLLPAVLYIAAISIGPSKAIFISKAPRPSSGKTGAPRSHYNRKT